MGPGKFRVIIDFRCWTIEDNGISGQLVVEGVLLSIEVLEPTANTDWPIEVNLTQTTIAFPVCIPR